MNQITQCTQQHDVFWQQQTQYDLPTSEGILKLVSNPKVKQFCLKNKEQHHCLSKSGIYVPFLFEGQGFADRRKKKIVHEYKKILRKEGRKLEEWSEKMHKIYTDEDKTATPSIKKLVKCVFYNQPPVSSFPPCSFAARSPHHLIESSVLHTIALHLTKSCILPSWSFVRFIIFIIYLVICVCSFCQVFFS